MHERGRSQMLREAYRMAQTRLGSLQKCLGGRLVRQSNDISNSKGKLTSVDNRQVRNDKFT